jgi:hypothetical protein
MSRTQAGYSLIAPLLLVVIAAMLLLPILEPTPPPEVVAITDRPAPLYDLETAMVLAGKAVPANMEEYYFFALFEVPVPDDEVSLLADKLRAAANEHDFLGIAGPDAQRNRSSLLAALEINREKPLAGLTLIFVGPAELRDEVIRVVRASGAEIRYVTYPKYSPEV